jgi:hypothetical protein
VVPPFFFELPSIGRMEFFRRVGGEPRVSIPQLAVVGLLEDVGDWKPSFQTQGASTSGIETATVATIP